MNHSKGFSLVEMLVAVAIIGIIAFLAVPNIVAIKSDGERNLAISRAEAVNLAVVSLIQAEGRDTAVTNWTGAADDQARYALISGYLGFAPATLTDYLPTGYTLALPADIATLSKATLTDPGGAAINY